MAPRRAAVVGESGESKAGTSGGFADGDVAMAKMSMLLDNLVASAREGLMTPT
jgi:hypothetical protein